MATAVEIDVDEILEKKFTVRLLRAIAKELTNYGGFEYHEREDLEQDLRTALVQRLPLFKPEKSSLKTFIRRVVKCKAADLVEHRYRQMRNAEFEEEEGLDDIRADGTCLLDSVTNDCHDLRLGIERRDPQEEFELQQDVQATLKSLPPDLQQVCQVVLEHKHSPEEMREFFSEKVLKQLHAHFARAGLEDYLD